MFFSRLASLVCLNVAPCGAASAAVLRVSVLADDTLTLLWVYCQAFYHGSLSQRTQTSRLTDLFAFLFCFTRMHACMQQPQSCHDLSSLEVRTGRWTSVRIFRGFGGCTTKIYKPLCKELQKKNAWGAFTWVRLVLVPKPNILELIKRVLVPYVKSSQLELKIVGSFLWTVTSPVGVSYSRL